MKMVRREPGQTTFALASTSVLLAAVVVLSIRFESDPQEDGGLAPMLIMGVLLFVIPVGVAIYLMSTTNRAQIAAAAVTVVSSLLVATCRIGNLAALVYPVIALGSIVVLGGVGAVLRMTQRQRSKRGPAANGSRSVAPKSASQRRHEPAVWGKRVESRGGNATG